MPGNYFYFFDCSYEPERDQPSQTAAKKKNFKKCVLVPLVNHSTQKIKTSNQKKGKSQVDSNLTRDMV